MKMKNVIIVSMLSFLFFSCSQDEDLLKEGFGKIPHYEMVNGEGNSELDNLEDEPALDVLKFTYKGNTYFSNCTFDGKIHIENEDVNRVFDELNNIPNVAIEIKSDFSVEFYDSKEDMDYANKLRDGSPLTRAEFSPDGTYIRNYELRLWDRAKGREKGGPFTHFYSNGIQGNQSPPTLRVDEAHLTRCGFNNNISSCQMWGEVHMTNLMVCQKGQYKRVKVTFYDGNFIGKSLTLPDIDVNRTYTYRDYFSGFGFNDLTSSFVVSYY